MDKQAVKDVLQALRTHQKVVIRARRALDVDGRTHLAGSMQDVVEGMAISISKLEEALKKEAPLVQQAVGRLNRALKR